jgi:phosphoglycerate dehydrogenase-like enzyme
MRVAILDDYQQISLASTDWSTVRSLGQIDVFAEHIGRTEALVSALEPYDVVVAMRERTPFDADRLGQLPRLRLLVTTGMGNASIDLEAAAARGITVCGTGGTGSPTAELTWGLILALLRHIPEEDKRLKLAGRAGGAALGFGGSWQRTVGTGLDGKRLGVVGLGHQGRRVADIGRAFGMKVVTWSQNLDPDVAKKAHAKAVSKEELFSSSDVVTVHYKLSPRSTGLVGAAELALMKPSAYLVNTSRGPLVDSAALLAALRSGAIAGAALDVYDVEPLPLSDPLRSAPNVVLTPHLGYVTEETYQVFYTDAAEDIVAFAEGSPVRVLTASLFLVRRLPAGVAAGQGQGTFERGRVPRGLDGVGEALVLAEEFGLRLDNVFQGAGRLVVGAELLTGGPGHVPAVQGHLHEEHRADVRRRGRAAHHVAVARPGRGVAPGADRFADLLRVVLAEAGVGGEVLVHQLLVDALAVRPALGGVRGPQDRVVEQGAQVPVAARGGCVERSFRYAGDRPGRLGRRGGHLRAQVLRFHGCRGYGGRVGRS